jgi:hypothetical protein
VHEADPATPAMRVPGLATILAEWQRPIVLIDSISFDAGYGYRFATHDADGTMWAAQVETTIGDVAAAVVLTALPAFVHALPPHPYSLLRMTLVDFAGQRALSAEVDTTSPEPDRAEVWERIWARCRREADAQRPEARSVFIDGEPYEGVVERCAGHLGITAMYDDLVVVAVVPEQIADGIRFGTLSPGSATRSR